VTLRPTCMRTSVLATLVPLAVAALVAGCGEQGSSGAGDDQAATWRDCTDAAYDEADGPAIRVPTGGGGTVTVKLPTSGPCGGGLVARVPGGVAGLDVGELDLDPSSAEVVRLSGAESPGEPVALLRVDGGVHPRGGFQPHLFVVTDRPTASVQEATVDGEPLLPFVATDGGAAPMTATCTDDGGVALLTATTSEPPGVILAWDVERTTFHIPAPGSVSSATAQVEDHIADPLLRKKVPELFEPGALFANC
jgi:hypothetical protein